MVCEFTLRVRNFPANLTDNEKEDLLRYFGAIDVKVITSKSKQKSVVYARFESKEMTRAVLHRLHQAKILNSYLYVEYANKQVPIFASNKLKEIESDDYKNRKYYKNFMSKLHSFNASVSFHQPPPSNLRYKYPLPNSTTINNIGHALASVPKFYTQVLHLMNKMNLPPPFANISKDDLKSLPQVVAEIESELESELESDDDGEKKSEIIPTKRSLPQKKAVKRPKFIKPNVIQTIRQPKGETEGVFEKSEIQSRKIEVKVATDCLENKVNQVLVMNLKIGEEKEEVPKPEQITDEELQSNRVSLKDLNVFPVFRDYHPGAPSSRLYIKNIAKSVEKSDLEYIYKRYTSEGQSNVFDIRLMQEGRMKGQAFITLDSVDTAQKALQETNGYILKDKPLVVVFARSVVPKV